MEKGAEINVQLHGFGKIVVPRGISLLELQAKADIEGDPVVPVVGALYNNRIMGLEYQITRNCNVRFITTKNLAGAKIRGIRTWHY